MVLHGNKSKVNIIQLWYSTQLFSLFYLIVLVMWPIYLFILSKKNQKQKVFCVVPDMKYFCGLSLSMKYGFPVGEKGFKGL